MREVLLTGGAAELYRRAGKDARVQKQVAANQRLEAAVGTLEARGNRDGAAPGDTKTMAGASAMAAGSR